MYLSWVADPRRPLRRRRTGRDGAELQQAASGERHSLLLLSNGEVHSCGDNSHGQLGRRGVQSEEQPILQSFKPHSIGALKNLGVIYISCGYEHTAVLTQTGKVFTFGSNSYGQRGHSPTAEKEGPQLMEGIDGLVSQIDCGSYHTLAYVYTTGKVVSFGRGPSCKSRPTHPEALTENADFTCLISADEQCWASLQESSLNKLVQMLKTAIISQLCQWTEHSQSYCNLKALLGVMKEVHKIPAENPSPIVLSDFPFIFPLQSKILLLRAASHLKMLDLKQKEYLDRGQVILPYDEFLTLRVRRSHLVEDALRQLSQVEDTDLCKVFVTEFIKEICSRGRGVISEFFYCIFEEMTKTEYGMFMYPEEGSYMWFPVSPKFEKKRYFLFGILCGLSLNNSNVANLPFPLALFKKLLDQKPSLQDLKELSPLLGKSLQEVLNNEADDLGEELYIYFSIHWDNKDVALIPNGISVPVDQTNKALPQRTEATRQMCCTRGRLVVLERGGAGVEVHQLPAGSEGAKKPKCIKLGKKMKIHSVDQGAEHMLILSSDGKPFEYHYSTEHARFQCILQEKSIIQITCGDYHSLALSKGEDFPSLIEPLDNQKVEFLACGGSHTALLTTDGLVFTFGAGKYGQLGHSSTQNELRPRLVTELAGNRVTQIACGRRHTLAYVSDLGKVFSFGSGKEGQLGNGGTHNQLIPLPMKLPSNEELKFESRTSEKELILIAGGNQSILLWMGKKITTCLRDNLLKNLPFHSPHQEALEIFFLLPECPMMHDYNNWESLVVPFAEAVCAMSDQSLGVLEEYWASLQEPAFIRLVQMFKRAITAQMHYWTESSENNYHVKALLEILKKLHRDTSVDTQYPVIFSHFPFIFNILSKIKLLYADSLLKIQVSFSGEIGHDSGGVKVEFFHCLFEEMTRPEYGMFMYPEEASYMWFPVRVHWDKNDTDLIPNGSCIIVDQTNKRDYISKCVNYIFNISVKALYEEFQRGFYRVCDKDIIEFFHPEELKDVIIGNTDYDWETFEKNAHYEEGYDNSHPTIVMFWKALHKLTLEEKKKFLDPESSSERLP
ncbi:hypothetical protein GH733_005650 [Mirounga leonina]|nr:hypothetical protein GH733_005650 [Mirounga leonina]